MKSSATPVSWPGASTMSGMSMICEIPLVVAPCVALAVPSEVQPALLRVWDKRQRGYRAMGYLVKAQRDLGEISEICADSTA